MARNYDDPQRASVHNFLTGRLHHKCPVLHYNGRIWQHSPECDGLMAMIDNYRWHGAGELAVMQFIVSLAMD